MNSKVTLLPGVKGIKWVYERTLTERRADFVCLSANYDQVLEGWWKGTFAKKLYGSEIVTRELVSDTVVNRKAETKGDVAHAVKVLPEATAEGDMILAKDWAALVSFGDAPYAVVYEDLEMVKYLKLVFATIWGNDR